MIGPQVDANRIAGGGLIAPELARRESHRVHMLLDQAERITSRVGVLERKRAMIAHDDAAAAARVTWQSSVAERIQIPRANVLAHFEARFHRRLGSRLA